MIQMLRSLFRRLAPFRQPAASFYSRCIRLDTFTARISLPTPPWWKEVTDEERPQFQNRFDEFYRSHPELVKFRPPLPGTKEYEDLEQRLREASNDVTSL